MRHLILLLLFALPAKAEIVAMTTNFAGVQAAIQASESYGELAARTGGMHYYLNGNSAIMVVDSVDGFEGLLADLVAQPSLGVTATNWREIFGYRVQNILNGEPQWVDHEIDPVPYERCEDNWQPDGGTDEFGFPTYANTPDCTTIDPEPYSVKLPLYDTVPRVPGLLEQYHAIYPYSVPDENGNTRSRFTVTFGADSVKDILNPEVPQ